LIRPRAPVAERDARLRCLVEVEPEAPLAVAAANQKARASDVGKPFGPVPVAVVGDDARLEVPRLAQDDRVGRSALVHHQDAVRGQAEQLAEHLIVAIAALQQIAGVGVENDAGCEAQALQVAHHLAHRFDARGVAAPVHHVRAVDDDPGRVLDRSCAPATEHEPEAREAGGPRDQNQVGKAGQGECRRDTGKRQEKQEERDQHRHGVACGKSGTVAAA